MTTLKLGNRELTVQYGYKVTAKTGIIKKVADLSKDDKKKDGTDRIQKVIDSLPELLLCGLQKYHRTEFGYNYLTDEGYEESLDKVYDILDDYFETDESDFNELFNALQKELLENGFLAKLFAAEIQKK